MLNDIISLFQKLLRFHSITPNDDGILDFITSYLNDWQVINLDIGDIKNRFYYKKWTNDTTHLCFAGHIDVVPVGNNWSVDPFEANIQTDGTIIARGAQDMKSGVSAFLFACKNMISFKGTISILLTSDEEGEAKDGTIKMLQHLKKIDFLPTCAIVAEPTSDKIFGDTIKVGRRGSINGTLAIQGKQGHVAYPQKTINPIHQIAPILNKIAGYEFDNGDKYFDKSRLIITDIRGGLEVTNVTPDNLKLMFNVRNSTKTSKDNIKRFIDKNFKYLTYNLKLTQNSYPFRTDINSKVIQKLQQSIQNILQISPKLDTSGGTSDARFFAKFNIDVVEFGVINDTIHAVDERTSIKEVQGLADIFSNMLKYYFID